MTQKIALMRVKIPAMVLSLVLTQLVSAMPPVDHPMTRAPRMFAPIKPWKHNIRWLGKQPDAARQLRWSFTLAKRNFVLGEPICGRLIVENSDDTFAYRLSPPYHGQYVSTISVWCGKHQPLEADPAGTFEEIVQVNHGQYESFEWQLEGEPLILLPGERFEQDIALNVMPVSRDASMTNNCGWYSGVGFSTPGNFRCFVRYINVEAAIPLLARRAKHAGSDLGHDHRIGEVPLDPVVLGPFDITIDPLNVPRGKEIAALLDSWQDLISAQYHHPISDNIEILEKTSPEALAAARSLTERKFVHLRQSFMLTDLRYRLRKLPESREQKLEMLRILEQETRHAMEVEMPVALADAWQLTRCQILRELGRDKEARDLAKKTNTPDTVVFLRDYLTK